MESGGDEGPKRSLMLSIFMLVVLLVSSAVVFGAIGIVITETAMISSRLGAKASGERPPACPRQFPHIYLVPPTHMTPVKEETHPETSWLHALVGFLEASYRANGVRKGFLNATEYVRFSEQAFGIFASNRCSGRVDDPSCFGGPLAGTSERGIPELLYYWRGSLDGALLPETACPASLDPGSCDQYAHKVKTNPLRFTVRALDSVYAASDIKQRLLATQLPLTWSQTFNSRIYEYPCDPVYRDTAQCQQCWFPCGTECCARIQLPHHDASGLLDIRGPSYAVSGHAMLIVGWNDEFPIYRGASTDFDTKTEGGFILKNSYGYGCGHSADFWAQKYSKVQEFDVCPLERSSRNWWASTYECMKSFADPRECPSQVLQVIRSKPVMGATALKCSERTRYPETAGALGAEFCIDSSPTARYVLETAEKPDNPLLTVPPKSAGEMYFHLIEYEPRRPSSVRRVRTSPTTWEAMELALEPEEMVGNTESCGFFFVPYDTFSELTVRSPQISRLTPAFSSFVVEWDDQSYAKKAVSGKNYDYVRSSTRVDPRPVFTGPLE